MRLDTAMRSITTSAAQAHKSVLERVKSVLGVNKDSREERNEVNRWALLTISKGG